MSPPRRAMAPIQRALDEQQEERREHHLPDAGMSYDSNATAPEDLSPGARASWYTNVTAAGAFSSSPRVPGAFTYSPVTVPASIADVAPAVPPAASTPPLPGANMFVVDLAAQQKAADMDNSGTTMMLDTSSCPASSTSIPNSLYELKAYERKSFCARWWWLLLLLTLLSLAGVGVGGYFLMPTVAQAFMDASQLRFQTIAITNATDGSFSATILGKISDAGPFSATTTPMRLTVYHQQQELGYMVGFARI